MLLLACHAASIHANAAAPQPRAKSQVRFDCADFEHLDNGDWKGKSYAGVSAGASIIDLTETMFGHGEFAIDGVDMKSRLDAQCAGKDKARG